MCTALSPHLLFNDALSIERCIHDNNGSEELEVREFRSERIWK